MDFQNSRESQRLSASSFPQKADDDTTNASLEPALSSVPPSAETSPEPLVTTSINAPDALSPSSPKRHFPTRTHKPVKTDTALKGLKPEAKPYSVSIALDGHGLYLWVTPKGKKYWRQAFRDPVTGKNSLRGYGVYPEVSLADALKKSAETRKRLLEGVNPVRFDKSLKAQKAAEASSEQHDFKSVAENWLKKINTVKAPASFQANRLKLEKYAYPLIGKTSVAKLKTKDFIEMLQPLEERGILSTLKRVRNLSQQVMDFAVTLGYIENNPLYAVKKVFPTPKPQHFPAITDAAEFGKLLAKIWTYHGSLTVRSAIRLLPYIFCRTAELRHMKWAEVDLEKAVWKYVATKTDQALIVPLSRQAVAILSELKPQTSDNPEGWVFPSPRGNPHKPVNFRVVLDALKYLGVSSDKMTGHGFRASAATLLEEMLGYDPKFINMQLAHLIKDPNGNAYRRAQFLEVRCEMMQVWADAIDKLREGEDADAVALWAKEEKARYAANKDAATREKIFAISSSAREQ